MKETRGGVSLLEIIIAMQITALILVMLCRILPLARRQVRDTDQKMSGAIVTQNVLEEYLIVPLESWPDEPVDRDGFQVRLSHLPWEQDSSMTLVSCAVLSGEVETYRLQTLVVSP